MSKFVKAAFKAAGSLKPKVTAAGLLAAGGMVYTLKPGQTTAMYKETGKILGHDRPPAYPMLDLGEVSRTGSRSILYIPGSLTNANENGYQFSKEFKKASGTKPSYINSQMHFYEYPGQVMGADSATERNNKVVDGVKRFIENSSEDEVILIAHSAGSKPALVAARKYAEANPESPKKIKIYLAGAGSPEGGLEKDLEELSKYRNISTTEFRSEFDIVPSLAGTSDKGQITRFASDVSKKITQDLIDHADSDPGDPFSNPEHIDRRLARSLKTISEIPKDHFSQIYIRPVAEEIRRHITSHTAMNLLNLHEATPKAPKTTPTKTAKKSKELK
jgi:pimeloyl-ACP methyl ester carboxylesterase